MEKIFRVKCNDGYVKEFADEKLALEFEAKVKKEMEEELERQKKAKEECKEKEKIKECKLKSMNELAEKLSFELNSFREKYGVSYHYSIDRDHVGKTMQTSYSVLSTEEIDNLLVALSNVKFDNV